MLIQNNGLPSSILFSAMRLAATNLIVLWLVVFESTVAIKQALCINIDRYLKYIFKKCMYIVISCVFTLMHLYNSLDHLHWLPKVSLMLLFSHQVI